MVCSSSMVTPPCSLPYPFLVVVARDFWLLNPGRHKSSPTNRPQLRICPTCNFRMPRKLNRRDRNWMHRIRLDVAFAKFYIHEICASSSPLCPTCGVRENLKHFVCRFQIFINPRKALLSNLRLCQDCPVHPEPWSGAASAARGQKHY